MAIPIEAIEDVWAAIIKGFAVALGTLLLATAAQSIGRAIQNMPEPSSPAGYHGPDIEFE